MNSIAEVMGIMLIASLATLVLFGVPTAIEVFLHHRRITEGKKSLQKIAKTSLDKHGNSITVPRKDK